MATSASTGPGAAAERAAPTSPSPAAAAASAKPASPAPAAAGQADTASEDMTTSASSAAGAAASSIGGIARSSLKTSSTVQRGSTAKIGRGRVDAAAFSQARASSFDGRARGAAAEVVASACADGNKCDRISLLQLSKRGPPSARLPSTELEVLGSPPPAPDAAAGWAPPYAAP